ncbi:MAG: DUF3098 domain-containing protein [Bacteroidota bacterium]|nr:DUF3098 domain-containing protein [Bacteroidota bacterium]
MGEAKSKKSQPNISNQPAAKPNVRIPESARLKATMPLQEMTYGKAQYKYMFIGLGLIVLGLILMSGGAMPSPDVWDESIIYSARRTVLAPIAILAGLAMQVVAIFKV